MTLSLHLDFETRATVDLKIVGGHVYAQHPDTRVLCASYSFGSDQPPRRWRPWLGEPMPGDLRRALLNPKVLIHAWNASFERLILQYVLKIPIPIRRFRCTMVRARSMALPGKLELAAKAVKLPVQKANNAVMLKWCKPLPNGGWADDPQEFETLCDYCDVDVETEAAMGEVLRDLSPDEWEDYAITEEINDRGVPVDIDLARAAQRYAEAEAAEIKRRLNTLTAGQVTSARQFQRIKIWLEANGVVLPADAKGKVSFDAATRAALLENEDISDDVREFTELVDSGGKASTAKFAVIEARGSLTGRVHGAFMFNGAGQTGRFSSTGAQLHNMVRKSFENISEVRAAVKAGMPVEKLTKLPYDKQTKTQGANILTILSRLLRPTITPHQTKKLRRRLVYGDWSSIEARVLPWLSDDRDADDLLNLFRRNGDVYKAQASGMFGVSIDSIDDFQRQAGKVAVLSLGFGGGAGAYLAMAKNYGFKVTREVADGYKVKWRAANPWAPRFWKKLEKAAMDAVRSPGTVFEAGRVAYYSAQGTLWCMMPCGRMLAYPRPRLERVDDKRGGTQTILTSIKGSFHPKAGEDNWPRMNLWGGFLAENITQGFSASLLRHALRTIRRSNWSTALIGHVHDEIIKDVPEEESRDAAEFLAKVMTTVPSFAKGLPMAAEIYITEVYGK